MIQKTLVDVLGLLLLAWLTGLLGDDGAGFGVNGIASLTLNILGFFVITYIIGAYIFPAGGKLLPYVKQRELGVSAVLIAAFAFSVFAEILGLHFILGAFIAGMFFGRGAVGQEVYEDVRNKISGITFGFLAPIFFASVGMNLSVNVFFEIPVFLVVLVVVAFLAKFFGAGMVAWMAGLSRRESCAVGVGMSARGAVELVIAGIALEAGLFIQPPGVESAILEHLYSAVVFMAIFTTLLAPIILKRIYTSQM